MPNTKAIVVGTLHELQRHQDTDPRLEQRRKEYEEAIRGLIEKRGMKLLAEEAGDDNAVWEKLKHEEETLGEYAELFGGGKIVEAPVPTITKIVADEVEIAHVDIRTDADVLTTIEERDEAMVQKIVEISQDEDNIMVIVGESHREGVAQRLRDKGFTVEMAQIL
jgi:hypothetical protein